MNEFILILPELFIALTLAFVLFGETTYHGERTRLISTTALLGLGGALVQALITARYSGPLLIFQKTFSVDGLALFFKLIFIVLAALSVAALGQLREVEPRRRAEFMALVLAAAFSMCIAASATDLFLAFLALQAVNALTYFIAGYGKKSGASIESAIKYMIFSAVAAGLFLYGLAMLFSATQTLNAHEIHQALIAHPLARESFGVILILLLFPLAFQIAAFPAHFWAPDVLEGAPTVASAFLSIGPRLAGLVVMIRLLIAVFAKAAGTQGHWQVLDSLDWTQVLGIISGVTLIFGSVAAYQQKNAKRMIGYLVIADTGFLLLGILVLDPVGLASMMYNLLVELFSLFGIYYVLAFIHDQIRSDRIDDFKGMLGRAVPECVCLILFLLCFAGLPPLPGFVGLFTLVGAAARHGWTALAVVTIASKAIGMAALGRLCYGLVGDIRSSIHQPIAPNRSRRIFLATLIAPLAAMGIFANWILAWAGRSLGFILW